MKKKVYCEVCGAEIPPERLEILPDTTTCVKCSTTEPYTGDEILGLTIAEEQDQNRLNVEDFEGTDTDGLRYSNNDDWQDDM